jgi:DNA-binding transcriptional LysR family regulator
MELNTLRTFFVLAQTGNYSKSAQKLFVTQSAVSHAIKRLETSLGLQLIDRTQKGFALTPSGNTLFQSCRTIFFELEKTKEHLLTTKTHPEVVRLGSQVEFGLSIVLKQIKSFLRQHPKIHVDFHLSHNLLADLLNDDLDMIIDCRPHTNPELKVIGLFREEYVVIAAADYIAEHRIEKISDLSRCNILSMDKQLIWWNNFVNALPLDKQGVFRQITEINHVRGIINAAQCGIGVGFVPRYTVVKDLEEGNLIELFPELDILNDQINIYIKRKRAGLEKNSLLINHIKGFRLQ